MTRSLAQAPLLVGGDDFELSPTLIDSAQFSNLSYSASLGESQVNFLLTDVSGLVTTYLGDQASAPAELADMLAVIGSLPDESLKQQCYAAYDQACLAIASGKPAAAALSTVRDVVIRAAGQSIGKVLGEMSVAEREELLIAERDKLMQRLTQEADRLRGELTQYIDPATNDRIASLRAAADRETDPVRKQQAEMAVLAAEREAAGQAVQGTDAALATARASGDPAAIAAAEAERERAAQYQATVRAREEVVREQLKSRYIQAGMSPERAEQMANQDAAQILGRSDVRATVADTSVDIASSDVIVNAVNSYSAQYTTPVPAELPPPSLAEPLTPTPVRVADNAVVNDTAPAVAVRI